MKVEFINDSSLGDGRQLIVQESEFKRAATDKKELFSLRLAIRAFHSLYAINPQFFVSEYHTVEKELKKNGTVIFCVIDDRPHVYVSNNGVLREVLFL